MGGWWVRADLNVPMHSQQPPGVVQNRSTLQCSKQNTEQCGYDHAPVTRGRMRAQFPLPHGPLSAPRGGACRPPCACVPRAVRLCSVVPSFGGVWAAYGLLGLRQTVFGALHPPWAAGGGVGGGRRCMCARARAYCSTGACPRPRGACLMRPVCPWPCCVGGGSAQRRCPISTGHEWGEEAYGSYALN